MANTTHLRAFQALEAAVRSGSMKAAAAELAITPAAVGQRIKTLEDYLGLDLLVRGRSGLRPTQELEAAMAHLTAAFRELNTVREILDFRRVHEIHVVADTDWAELWLKPRLPRFKAAHPNTLFCINGVGDIPVRLGEADCEVWFGEPGGSGLEYQLFRDYLMPVSSPANTLRMSKRRTDEPLEGFPPLHLDCYNADPASIGWPEWVNKYGYRKSVAGRGIRYRRIIHALEAVYSNAGILVCGLALVLEELDRERLSLPFPISLGSWSGHAYHVAFRDSALRRNQTALFRDWLLREGKTTHEQLCQLTAAA